MRVALITFIFSIAAVLVARTLIKIQFSPVRLTAFSAIIASTVILLAQPLIAIYLVIASITFYDPRYGFPGIHLWLHQWIILASLLFFIGQYIYRRQKLSLSPLDLGLGVFLATFLLSLINSPNFFLSIKWITYFLVFLGGYLLLRLAVSNEKQLMGIVLFLIFCGVINSVISYFSPRVAGRVVSLVLKRSNTLGNFLALILPLSLTFALHGSFSRPKRILIGLGSLAILASIILTLSRSSWAGITTGLLALGVFRPRLKSFIVIALIFGLMIFLSPVRGRLIEDKADAGVIYRQAKIKMAYQMFRKNPVLGQGPGSFQALAPRSEYWGIKAHSGLENLYMRILAEGGLLQALVFISLVIYITHLGISTANALSPGFLQTSVLGSLAGFWAVVGIGIGEDPIIFPMINWLVGFYIAIILKARELSGLTKI